MSIVHPRDRSATWSASIHSVGQRPKVYSALLEEFVRGYGDTADHEYNLPPTDRWSIGEGVRGHLRACVLDHKVSWEKHLPLLEFA